MGCAGSAEPDVPKGDGFFALPWPKNTEKHQVALGHCSHPWANRLPIFAKSVTLLLAKFDRLATLDCMILMNQDALFQKLLEENYGPQASMPAAMDKANRPVDAAAVQAGDKLKKLKEDNLGALPFPPNDAIEKGAKECPFKLGGTLGCQILLNQSAIFKKLSGDEVFELPWPVGDWTRSHAENMDASANKRWLVRSWDCRVLCNDNAIFCKLAGETIKTLPFPPDETVTRLAGEESPMMWDCQQIMNQHSILQKLQVACLLGTVHTPKSSDGSKLDTPRSSDGPKLDAHLALEI